MKSLTKILFALLFVAITGFAKAEVQDRHITGFNGIDVAGPFDVFITQGSTESVRVEAPDDVIDKIKTDVSGGMLKIYTRDKWNWGDFNIFGNHKKMVVYITAKALNSILLTGSGDVKLRNTITAKSLKIRVSGSGDIDGSISTDELEAGISGSGDVKLSGRARNSRVSVTGSGDYRAADLITSNTTVNVTGSGDASVHVNDRLEAMVTGSGDVRYTGTVKSISSSKTGSGDIHRM